MTIAPFRRVRSSDDVIRQLQDAVGLPLNDLSSKAILDGNLLTGINLVTGKDNVIDHKLGRPLIGYFVVMQNAQANFWSTQTTNKLPQFNLFLRTSADVTISLWVF